MARKKAFWIVQVVLLIAVALLIWQKWYYWLAIPIIIEAILLYGSFREKEENQYVLPATVARTMKVAPERLAHESTILSTSLLIIGSIAFAVYYCIYMPASWVVKGFIIFNALCLALFMLAQLQTSYRQYVALMETQKMIESMDTEKIEVVRFTDDITDIKDELKGGQINNGKNKR
jgi:hypothetical protein